MSIHKKLAEVQQKLHAPKGQFNKFGGYYYRNCEDILQAVKPLLGECVIIINDDIQLIHDRVYVKATATFTDGEHNVEASAFAREALNKKGMDESQITGAASSYARKYALNALLLIDDNKDADSNLTIEEKVAQATKVEHLNSVYNTLSEQDKENYKPLFGERRKEIEGK